MYFVGAYKFWVKKFSPPSSIVSKLLTFKCFITNIKYYIDVIRRRIKM